MKRRRNPEKTEKELNMNALHMLLENSDLYLNSKRKEPEKRDAEMSEDAKALQVFE